MASSAANLSCTIDGRPFHAACYLRAKINVGQVTDESGCVWTCEDIKYYCARSSWYDHIITVGQLVTHPLQYELYHLGCACNLLLFLTLLSRTLVGSTFMYLRVISFVQFCLGALYYFHPGAEPDLTRDWAYTVVWPEIMKDTIVSGRFMLNILSVFMIADRFLAVVVPTAYSRVNVKKFFYASVAISFLISLIEMESIFRNKFPPKFAWRPMPKNHSDYKLVPELVGNYVYTNIIVYIVITIKAILLLCSSLGGAAVALSLFARGRRVSKMLMADAAVKEYKEMLALCLFQMVDTAVMMIDIIVTVLMDLQLVVEIPGDQRGNYCAMADNLYSVNMYLAGWILDVTKDQFLSLEHGELFFIYLLTFGKFRRAFVDVCMVAYNFCWKPCKKVTVAVAPPPPRVVNVAKKAESRV